MTVELTRLEEALDELLQPRTFKDYCPNGLQVEGRQQVGKLICGVTASQALIDAAIEQQADALLVHHGFFWRGEDAVITGMKRRRIKALLDHDISLLAYHLPLDAHPRYGNNAQLGQLLGFDIEASVGDSGDESLVMLGQPAQPMTHAQMRALLQDKLGREAVSVQAGEELIKRVAWCTGAAQGFIEVASRAGADAYISGEISEQTTHVARECGLHFFAAGHHATERYGVQAVGRYLAEQFAIEYQFIDIDNPA